MTKIIEFIAPKDYLDHEEKIVYPEPIKLHMSDWYKKLKTSWEYPTVKSCIPFLESMTTGYALKVPQEMEIIVENDKMEIRLPRNASMFEDLMEPHNPEHKINLHFEKSIKSNLHSQGQLGKDCPYHKNQNKFSDVADIPYVKIMYPFKIKTPKGYACLFMPPLNVEKKDYEILSGIVDTDTFPMYVNFPFKMTGKSKKVTLKKGEIFAQCIPYKKESWSLKVSADKESKRAQKLKKIFFFSYIIDNYKKIVWNKQRWN